MPDKVLKLLLRLQRNKKAALEIRIRTLSLKHLNLFIYLIYVQNINFVSGMWKMICRGENRLAMITVFYPLRIHTVLQISN